MARAWVVVADSTHARLFDVDLLGGKFDEMTGLVHEQSRSQKSELQTDKDGRSFDPTGGGRHGLQKHLSPHEHEAEIFARLIADRLLEGHKAGDFNKIHLAAPPAFLGILRHCFDKQIHEQIDKVINKNIVNEKPENISDHFFGSHISNRAGEGD